MKSKYTGPYWIFVSDVTNMPLQVEKCTFRPTIHPTPSGNWVEVYNVPTTELIRLESLIAGHIEAMRPLLDRWSKMRLKKETKKTCPSEDREID